MFAYEILETISWSFTHAGFTIQVIQAVDLDWYFNHHFSLIIGIALLVVIVGIFTFNPFFNSKYIDFNVYHYAIFVVGLFLFLYPLYSYFMAHLFPYEEMTNLSPAARKLFFGKLEKFLRQPMVVKSDKKKNLIIFEIESLEQQILGRFNPFYPLTMPFLSNLSTQGAFVEKMESLPYTTWSVASMFATQCNFPLLMTPDAMYNNAKFHLNPNHRCVGDYLKLGGYNLLSYLANIFIGGFKKQLKMHEWDVRDFEDHGFRRDWDLFGYLAENVLPNLTKPSNQPFVLHIANADTHPFPSFFVDERCESRVPKYPKMLQSFDCLDQILEKFIKKIISSGLLENTEIIFYGDHLVMGRIKDNGNLMEPRYICAMLPFRKKEIISKSTSIYDLAPTFMDLLGVEYEPKFPYGSSFFSSHVGQRPDETQFRFIYDYFAESMKWSKDVHCGKDQKSGFCKTT